MSFSQPGHEVGACCDLHLTQPHHISLLCCQESSASFLPTDLLPNCTLWQCSANVLLATRFALIKSQSYWKGKYRKRESNNGSNTYNSSSQESLSLTPQLKVRLQMSGSSTSSIVPMLQHWGAWASNKNNIHQYSILAIKIRFFFSWTYRLIY